MTAPSLRPTQIIASTGKYRTEGDQRAILKSRAVSFAQTLGKLREAHEPEGGYTNSGVGPTAAGSLYKELQLTATVVRMAEEEAQVHEPTAAWLARVRPIIAEIDALKDAPMPVAAVNTWPRGWDGPAEVRRRGRLRGPAVLREFGFTVTGA